MKAEEAVNAVFEAMIAALKRGDDVRLPAFGVFDVKAHRSRAPRAIRKPARSGSAGRAARCASSPARR